MIYITSLTKIGGPLTKRIALTDDGTLLSDGSSCIMPSGTGERASFNTLSEFAAYISSLGSHQAIALGSLRRGLPDKVEITTKGQLEKLNGTSAPNLIARSAEHISYVPDYAALVLLDYDTKGMPDHVKNKIRKAGGFWPALMSVLPELETAGRVIRRSTSAGLSRTDTGVELPGSDGQHAYILAKDGADAKRFLYVLHDRCWLAELGWMMVGAGGQLLERSLIDRTVFAGERLAFEGAPVLEPPLVQDQASRQAVAHNGGPLDTRATCLDLSVVEKAKLAQLRAKEAHRLAPDRAKARASFIAEHTKRIAERSGITTEAARRVVERQCDGVLLSGVVLPFDAEEFAGCTVDDVLANPERFVGATLADPLEGIEYGTCKAMVMQRADGSLWINSFAHGRTVYDLKHGAAAIEKIIEKTPDNEVVGVFVRLVIGADLEAHDRERLRDAINTRTGTNKRTIDQAIAQGRKEHEGRQKQEERDRRAANRHDQRPRIAAPAQDEPWIPQVQVINDVLSMSSWSVPPVRDIDGDATRKKMRRIPGMHLLTSDTANPDETVADETSYLPAPEQPCLVKMSEMELAEMIEAHIDYVDGNGRSVHLPTQFVRHYMRRDDGVLPTMVAIAQSPIILADGGVLAMEDGIDRDRGIVFDISKELIGCLPKRGDCTPAAVAEAMRFLCNDWLCDVSCSYSGKCIIIAAALSIIERSLLPNRPVFFVTAARRSSGKTTLFHMMMMAVLGTQAACAAWSPAEEERRKALLAYLMEGTPYIIWDNIGRGSQISCKNIELSCTTALYTDRKLGVSEVVAVAASAIHLFTGNNVGPKGDLASRALTATIVVDRADPENRPFKHNDPIGWTEAHRGQIMAALYTLLLGNPFLRTPINAECKTRFKIWWRLCGSAVENAAKEHAASGAERQGEITAMEAIFPPDRDEEWRVRRAELDHQTCPPQAIDFKDLFLVQEEDDEESSSLADTLELMAKKWPKQVSANDLTKVINDHQSGYASDDDKNLGGTLREFLFPALPVGHDVTAKAVSNRLKRHADEPVKKSDTTFILKTNVDSHTKMIAYFVELRS